MVRRRAERLALERLRACIVMVGHLLQPLGAGVIDQRVEADHNLRQIIEQRVETVMELWQPMLHALMLAPGRHRLVERVVSGGRSEELHIALAEGAADVRRERKLAHRQKLDLIEPRGGPLRVGIESPDRLQRVAEEVEANRLRYRRIKIED